jgi:hypothetical protein
VSFSGKVIQSAPQFTPNAVVRRSERIRNSTNLAEISESDIQFFQENGMLAYHVFGQDPQYESQAGPEWDETELKEVQNLHKFKSFGYIKRKKDLSKDSQVPTFRIVFKTKLNPDGSLDKRKVRYALRKDIDKQKNLLSTYSGCIELPINLLNL